ncbi:protein mono-ADP-ribosyltransferase PARP12-like [Protopterus annectens]|uniref:protein mono-ADP-ribosyltransferase PARP12-like n=1 Tax=Protopterus annectens TaxID=7888 RepID=UPI001CFB8FC4|nr:protein mono-ADP-ribosyltransferase PARP12-like [Protopterus annectens]
MAELLAYITKLICSSQSGFLEYDEIHKLTKVPDLLLRQVLENKDHFVIANYPADKKRVFATTALKLCELYPKGECDGVCEQLHLCKYFIYRSCRSKGKCKFSHDIHDPHNSKVMEVNKLSGLNETEMSVLLLHSDPGLLPDVCQHYNKGDGQFGACTYKNECFKLHMCYYFMQGNCRFGNGCKRCHRFTDNASLNRLLQKSNLNGNLLENLQAIYEHKNHGNLNSREEEAELDIYSSPNQDESKEICLYNIRKTCGYKGRCKYVHFHLPYRWQFFDGMAWTDFDKMEEIEKAYCDAKNDSFPSVRIDFENMVYNLNAVQRLSTASSVTKPPYYILTTEWHWYWEEDNGIWNEYGKEGAKGSTANVTSQDLENIYLASEAEPVYFTAGDLTYELDFLDMSQKSLYYKTKRRVRRRPTFISAEDVDKKIKSQEVSSQRRAMLLNTIPEYWDKSTLPELSYKVVDVPESSDEYKKIKDLFMETMTGSNIMKIQRIQNMNLWGDFQWQKEKMIKQNGGLDVDERILFHGTDLANVDAICEQNFDWRLCNDSTRYGKGSYFAKDAYFANRYSSSESGLRVLFVARVLVGKFTVGKPEYTRPPTMGDNQFYDSCVNKHPDPSIFVVFEKHQIYPEYIIEFV